MTDPRAAVLEAVAAGLGGRPLPLPAGDPVALERTRERVAIHQRLAELHRRLERLEEGRG